MRIALAMAFLAVGALQAAAALDPGVNQRSLTVAEVTYPYQVYRPASVDGSSPVPLVVDIHGWSSNGVQQAGLSGMRAVADREGFLVTHPSGPSNAWEAGVCCLFNEERDDVAFFRALVAAIEAEANVDPRRVYVTGLSNGGAMSHRLACDAADLFAAAAPLAFPIPLESLSDCRPSRSVPLLMFMGLTDVLVPYEDGPYGDARESFGHWRDVNGCHDGDPDDVVTAESGLSYCETYTGCANDVDTGLCSITARSFGGAFFDGHILYLNDDFVLADIVWDFLSRWLLPEDTSAPSGLVRGKTTLTAGGTKTKAKTEWTVTLGGGTWSAIDPDGRVLAGAFSGSGPKSRKLALTLTEASMPALAEVVRAAGAPVLLPQELTPDFVATTNKKRTRVKLRGTVDLGGAGTFTLRLAGKLQAS
jgi:polyhydroxybutyrate depolymerase